LAFSSEHVGDALLDSINRPFRSLPELLEALMRALAERSRLNEASLSLEGAGTLLLDRRDGAIRCEWRSPAPAPARAIAARGANRLVLPIAYAEVRLGELSLAMDPLPRPGDPETELLSHFARHCGLLIKRYDVRRWSEQRLGQPLILIGMSKALRELESFLEISARGRLPVLMRGEFGTEKAQLAATIHCCSPACDGPFVQIDCAEPSSPPSEWIQAAEGGTLYLSDVDELEPRLQKQLPRHLPSRLQQWLPGPSTRQVRVIASTTADLQERTREGLFSRSLLAELDFLSVTIPPLRERTGDIDALVAHMLERNGYRVEEKVSEALISLCRAHHWPENLFELERMIARLAVMSEGRRIQLGDISRHAPAMLAAGGPDDGDARDEQQDDESETGEDGSTPAGAADRWARAALERDEQALRGLHDGLRRALLYLGARYDEPMTLTALARHAGVSSSHLGFLFRSALGLSFKALLGHIRILKAREMLSSGSRQNITQVALTVGYADLSHFERSFRRIVGTSPREFRRSIKEFC
jgi:DNA-binding NtrC family response regulator